MNRIRLQTSPFSLLRIAPMTARVVVPDEVMYLALTAGENAVRVDLSDRVTLVIEARLNAAGDVVVDLTVELHPPEDAPALALVAA